MPEFETLIDKLYRYELAGFIPTTRQWIGKAHKDYHYNFKVGDGEGAIAIGFKHNSSSSLRKEWDLRVEVNPSKHCEENRTFVALQKVVGHRRCVITGMDLAFDLPVSLEAVYVIPKSGREENRIKGTRYYGTRGKNGYLRVYDKRAEREGKGEQVEGDSPLTRVELCIRCEELPREYVKSLVPSNLFSEFYDIYKIGEFGTEVTPEIRCLVLGVQNGWVQLKDFTRTNQQKVKNALAGTEKLALDRSLQEHWQSISDTILRFTYDYYTSTSTFWESVSV